MEIKDIIKSRRVDMGLTMKELAEKVGVSEGTVSRWESGNISNMKRDKVALLSKILSIPLEVLMGWESDADRFWAWAKEFNSTHFPDNIQSIGKQTLPIIGEVSCGEPRLMVEECEVYTSARTDVRADAILIAKGDSMTGARIYEGDLVFVRFQPTVENGEIAVVAINDEATLKRFYKHGNDLIILRAENPAYEDIVIREGDGKDVRILGKAVAFQSDIR